MLEIVGTVLGLNAFFVNLPSPLCHCRGGGEGGRGGQVITIHHSWHWPGGMAMCARASQATPGRAVKRQTVPWMH